MRNLLFLFLFVLGLSLAAAAQGPNDVSLVVGAKVTPSVSSASGSTKVNTALGFEGSLAVQVQGLPFASLQVELPVMATPNATVNSSNFLASKSYNSVYITPGIRLKFKPTAIFNPWVAAGGGIVRFGPSPFTQLGGTSAAAGALKGTIDVGGGVDFKAPHVPFTLRMEVREYYSGAPNLNISNLSLHNNIFAGAGLVVRF